MHNRAPSPLEQAFGEDHRDLTRLLSTLLEQVRQGNIAAARRTADALDRAAGPHIVFEEEVLYPMVASAMGAEFAARLYGEHEEGRSAVEALLAAPQDGPPDALAISGLEERLEIAQQHVLSCGSLASHLHNLPADEQTRTLDRLLDYRRQARRWSELPRHPGSPAPSSG